jgi:enediyne polyketide synthase
MSKSAVKTYETSTPKIAVIGLACRYPGAENLCSLWENILTRRRYFRDLPAQRLPLSEYYDADPTVPDKTYGNRAAVIDGFEFDRINWRIPKTAFDSTDIVHWLALETADRALQDAGYSRSQVPTQKTGVIVGNTLTGEQTRFNTMRLRWPYVRKSLQASARVQQMSPAATEALVETMEEVYKSVFPPITEDSLAGGLSNTIAGRICNTFNFDGGGYTVDGACASSLLAIATAANALVNGDLDLALAGGVDVSLDTFELIGFAKTGALTASDMSVYDRYASGFIPGEGCGFVVLKRLEDARAHGDYVYAVLNGWGISSDGKGGITAPSIDGQAKAIQRAYHKAGYSPHRLDFIEGHGTGTSVGDRVELEGIASVISNDGEIAPRSIGVTSFKSIVGHTKAAAGVGGLIKAILAVNQRIIPPTAGCKEPNPIFASSARGVYPVLTGIIRSPEAVLYAGVSAMGFGGINSHVTISSADAPATHFKPTLEERSLLVANQETELFVLGASSVPALIELTQSIILQAAGMSLAELPDLAAHSQDLKSNQPLRAAIIASTPKELIERLQHLDRLLHQQPPIPGEIKAFSQQSIWISNKVDRSRVGFLFPGQGSQKLNMGRMLIERYPWARDLLNKCDRTLQALGSKPISPFLDRCLERAADPAELAQWQNQLAQTDIAQPAICLNSVLWSQYLQRLGIHPVAVGGHSLGELTAFHTAGAFDVESLLSLAAIRGQAMSIPDKMTGAMASLGCSAEVAQTLLNSVSGYGVVANINSPQQTVVSGDRSTIEAVIQLAADRHISTHLLPVSHAFHSQLVASSAQQLRTATVIPETLGALSVPLISSVQGARVHEGMNLRAHFAEQVTSQVDFIALVKEIAPQCDLLVEVGSGRVLSGLTNAIVSNEQSLCLPVESKPNSDRDLNQVLATFFVCGGEINWQILYENRLVRPFVPASQRQFIENPCERPLQIPREANNDRQFDSGQVAESISNTDLVETLSNYLVQRGEFLAQVIGADLQALPQLVANPSPQAKPIAPLTPNFDREQDLRQTIEYQPLTPDLDKSADVTELLLQLVEERTGFPKATLSLHLRLLDDLNLDSIKAAELVASVAKRLGVSGEIDPSLLANATLDELIAALKTAISQVKLPVPSPQIAADNNTHNSSSWVRNFTVKLVPQDLPVKPSESWSLARVLLVADMVESPVIESFRRQLQELGAEVNSITYQQMSERESNKDTFSHYLAILPQDSTATSLPLAQMMTRLKSIALPHTQPNACIAYVQFGGGDFGRSVGQSDRCCAAAFARSLHLERADWCVRVIDLATEIEVNLAAKLAIAELGGTEAISTVGYNANCGRQVTQARLQQPIQYQKRSLYWSSQDVVLVTGGAKGITAECALAFAQSKGVKMALVGRSAAPTATERTSEVAQTLARFQAAGLTCHYYACDITDAAAVAKLIAKVTTELGSITAVIHGAGLNQPRRNEQVSLEVARAEVAPKILGAENLLQQISLDSLRMFIAFSSIIGVTGMPGNTWYGFANEVLDISLRRFQQSHPEVQILSLAYSVWDEVGMGVRMGSIKSLARMGIAPIPVQEGVQRFLQLMDYDPGDPQVLIAARLGGLDTWSPIPIADATNFRFIEQVQFVEPGVELVTRAHLSLKSDRYIQDHLWRGSYLFPTVFGLEAMAQAVAYVTGSLEIARIENISLARPIVVDPDTGVEIEIRAEVMEATANGEQQIQVAIRTEQTGFGSDHFTAVFVLGERSAKTQINLDQQEPLDIDPQTDLYGDLLFQGDRFQRIETISSLTSDTAVLQSAVSETENSFAADLGQILLLGDPYFRDVMLQSVQLTIPQDICLPIHIGTIQLCQHPDSSPSKRIVKALLQQREGDEYIAEVVATDEQGYIFERIVGYRLRILEKHANNPTAAELAFPETRDRLLLKSVLDSISKQGLTMPAVALGYTPNLQSKPKQQRLQQEYPIVAQALQQKLGLSASQALDFGIQSLPSGKPELTGIDGLDLSLSHCDCYCLAVVSESPQGCDIEAITLRSKEDWVAILGASRSQVVEELVKQGDPRDRAGTRLWSALEAVRKAFNGTNPEFTIVKQVNDLVLLHASTSVGECQVATIPIRLTRPPERMVAIVIPPAVKDVVNNAIDLRDRYSSRYTNDGPQGQPVYQQRFQVSFKESGSISRHIYFSQYFRWIGKIRELPMERIASEVLADFSSGDWGMVTNAVSLRVLGEATAYDTIQARAWLGSIEGSSFTTYIEFCQVLPDNSLTQLAIADVKATWVQLKSYGVPAPMPFPTYLEEYLDSFAAQKSVNLDLQHPETFLLPPLPALMHLELGLPVPQTAPANSRYGKLLRSEVFQTTLEESNLVGNVYYGNYFIWQGRILDLFLYSVAPEYLRVSNAQGEMLCLYTRMDYLREAMPFDRIRTLLYVESVFECGATFNFEFFREQPDGSLEKLHVGQQKVAWVKRQIDGTAVATPLPPTVRRSLLQSHESMSNLATDFIKEK